MPDDPKTFDFIIYAAAVVGAITTLVGVPVWLYRHRETIKYGWTITRDKSKEWLLTVRYHRLNQICFDRWKIGANGRPFGPYCWLCLNGHSHHRKPEHYKGKFELMKDVTEVWICPTCKASSNADGHHTLSHASLLYVQRMQAQLEIEAEAVTKRLLAHRDIVHLPNDYLQ